MIVFVKAKVTSKSNMTERRIKTRPESPTGDNRNSSDLISLELTICVEKKNNIGIDDRLWHLPIAKRIMNGRM